MLPLKNPHNFLNSATVAGLHLIAVCLISSATAADYTYTIPASGTTQWNAGTNWGGATAPVSAATTALIFSGSQIAGASAASNNDIVSGGNGFQLNKLTFSANGPATGITPTFAITGNALEFINNGATTPTMALSGGSGVKATVNISNNLVLTNNLAVTLATNLTGTLSGVISGSGALSKSTGTSTLVLTNTSNSFSGGVTLSNGSLTVANIGNTGGTSALGTNGTVNISTAGNAAQFTWTGNSETSDKTLRITNSTGNATLTAQTASQTLTLSNSVLLTSSSAKTLTFNGSGGFSLTGSILGSGVSNPATALTKSGAGRLTLTGTASDFTGAVTISQGEIYATTLGSTTSASSLGKGSIINLGGTINAGTLRLLGTSTETTDKTLSMSGTTGGANITVTGATYTFSQNLGISGTGDKTLSFSSSGGNSGQGINFNGLIADGISSAISFRANGSGNATFALGNTANSFSGGVTVDGNTSGRIYVLKAALIGNTGGTNSSLGTSGTINLGSNTAGSINLLSYTGTGESSNKLVNFSGTGGDAGLDQSGTGLLKFTSNLTVSGAGAKTFSLRGSSAGTGEFAGNIVDGSGTVSLEKSGSGTWTLSGANSYTGTTKVTGGKLVINGSTSSTSLVTIAAEASLGGSGIVSGATTISGIHAPGNSPGIQTFSNNLSYASGARVEWELNGNTTAQGSPTALFDQILVGGNLDFAGLNIIDLSFTASGSGVNWNDTFWNSSHASTAGWLLYDVTGTTTNRLNLSVNSADWQDASGNLFNTARAGSSFGLEQVGNDLYLTYTAVPESGTTLLGGLGVLLLLRRRRA
jgi:autotransporter-associated beta strand protein